MIGMIRQGPTLLKNVQIGMRPVFFAGKNRFCSSLPKISEEEIKRNDKIMKLLKNVAIGGIAGAVIGYNVEREKDYDGGMIREAWDRASDGPGTRMFEGGLIGMCVGAFPKTTAVSVLVAGEAIGSLAVIGGVIGCIGIFGVCTGIVGAGIAFDIAAEEEKRRKAEEEKGRWW